MTEAVNFPQAQRRRMTDAELIAEARKVAPLYGNDYGVLLIELAERLENWIALHAAHMAAAEAVKKSAESSIDAAIKNSQAEMSMIRFPSS